MSVEIAWKQNVLVTDFHLLKSLLVVLGFGSQAFVCGFSRQNINSVLDGSNRLWYINHWTWAIILADECIPPGQMVMMQNTTRWLYSILYINIHSLLEYFVNWQSMGSTKVYKSIILESKLPPSLKLANYQYLFMYFKTGIKKDL